MEKQQVNPWTWQDQFGYSQAWRVDRPSAVIFVAGQGPLSAEGEFVGALRELPDRRLGALRVRDQVRECGG
jgi:enamine deaminase RidA (YjgF/YER057c/UK114 family)